MADCVAYLTIDDVRDEFGDDVDSMTDAQIQRRIDRMVAFLEGELGHTFGRALIARSSVAETVQVTATGVVIGGDTYLFATYVTLGALVAAINGAADTYRVELLSAVAPDTPSDLLSLLAATACGPDAEDRVVLCLSALWVRLSGDGSSELFVPLPVGSVTEVVENNVTLDDTAYWAVPGESWLTRKLCGCADVGSCVHPTGRWSNRYPGNITVTYVPGWWIGGPPATLQATLLEAFESASGLGPLEAESFGEYSYRRGSRQVESWREVLGGVAVRQYVIRWAP
jgi:hypothetical protein